MMRVGCLQVFLIGGCLALRRHSNSVNGTQQVEYVTVQGCKCKSDSQCKSDAGTGFKCDTCKTQGGCGTWSLAGRWDYCDYRPETVASFISKSWESKMSYFWSKITSDDTRYPEYPLLSNFLGSVKTTFDNFMPEMPAGREKMIHTVGSVCQFELDVSSKSPYTGVFGPGKQRGLIRLGSALDPASFGPGITPGLGLKFPRSGVPDGDFVGLHSLAFGTEWDFFGKNQSTHVEPLTTLSVRVLVAKFKEGSDCPYQIGLSDMGRYSQDGTEYNPPRFPFKVMFIANSELQTGKGEKSVDGVHAEIDAIRPGTKLYELWACGEPTGDEMQPANDLSACGKPTFLGDIRTASRCTTSQYGDAQLHFRHTRIEDDWALEPSYKQARGAFNINKVCGRDQDGIPPPKCGIEGMLNNDA